MNTLLITAVRTAGAGACLLLAGFCLLPAARGQTAPPMPTRRPTSRPQGSTPAVAAPLPMHFKVTAEDGKPLEGVQLSLYDSNSSISAAVTATSRLWHEQATTDANGEAAATYTPASGQIGPRPIMIVATAPGFAPFFMRGVEPYTQPVFPLVLHPGQTLTGIIKNDHGEALSGVKVKAKRTEGPLQESDLFTLNAVTGSDGRFEFKGVPDAKFVLTAEIPSKLGAWTAPATDVLVGALPMTPIEVVAHPGVVIKGQIIAPSEAEITKLQQFYVGLRSPLNTSALIPVAPDGHFEVLGIPAGAKGSIYLYLSTAGGFTPNFAWDKPPAGITVSPSGSVGAVFGDVPTGVYDGLKIEFVKFAKVHGTITDSGGSPVENVTVRVVSTVAGFSGYSKADGTYEVMAPPGAAAHLEVGSASAVGRGGGRGAAPIPGAVPPVQIQPITLPEFTLAPDQALEKSITVKVIPRPPHKESITGQVFGADGQPVVGATVYLPNQALIPNDLTAIEREGERPTWTGGITGPATTKVLPEGFSFNTLHEGTSDLWAYEPSAGWGMARNVKTGAFGVEIRLAPQSDPLQIAGQVIGPDGKPAAEARVIILPGANSLQLLGDTKADGDGKFKVEASLKQQTAAYLRVLCIPASGAITWMNIPCMSVDNVKIDLKSEIPLTGHVMDKDKKPIAGATVMMTSIRDVTAGTVSFPQQGSPAGGGGRGRGVPAPTGPSLGSMAPSATTDAQGQYTLHGLSAASTAVAAVSNAPNYGSTSYASSIGPNGPQPLDMTLRENVSVEGTVRGQNGQAVAGAKVALRNGTQELYATTTDDKGVYHLSGPENYFYRPTLEAQIGSGADQLVGKVTATVDITGGEHATGMDIQLEPSMAARQAAWIAKAAANPAPTPLIAVLDDGVPQANVLLTSNGLLSEADAIRAEQAALQQALLAQAQLAQGRGAVIAAQPNQPASATVTLYDAEHQQRWQYPGLNVARANLRTPISALDPKDKAIWVCEPATGRVLRIKADGALDWEKPGLNAQGLVLDPESSNAWVFTSVASTPYISHAVVLNPQGEMVKEFDISAGGINNGLNIAYSPHDRAFWISGTTTVKFDLEGRIAAQSPVSFNNLSLGVAANAVDGTAWILDGDSAYDTGGQRKLLRLASDSRPEKQFPFEASSLVVDGARNNLWSINSQGELVRSNLEGGNPQRIPVLPSNLALEPASGYLWAAARDGIYRIDPQGNYVWHMPVKNITQKWVLVLPQ